MAMTTYTPRPHGEYLEWIDKKLAAKGKFIIDLESMVDRYPPIASLLQEANEDYESWSANRDTLEKHKGRSSRPSDFAFPAETEEIRAKQEALRYCRICRTMDCPTYTDIAKHLDGVME